MLGLFIYLLFVGLLAGFLARLLVPGKDPLSIGQTLLIGIIGSFVGGLLGTIPALVVVMTDWRKIM